MLKLLQYYAKRPYHFLKTGILQGIPAQLQSGFPNNKLVIIIITGTDGKTTTSSLLYHILQTAQIKAGLISTVAAFIGSKESDTGFHVTSPQPKDMYKFMRTMVSEGCTHLVLEATSHGAYQYRTWGIKPTYAGLTNIANEHLDYHVNYQEYVKAKMSLLSKAKRIFLNQDDASLETITQLFPKLKYETYSSADSLAPKLESAVNKRFAENYNRMNARLAIKLAQANGAADSDIAKAIESFPGIPGRMEVITEKPCKMIVDFAHTPQGLKAALTQLKKQKKSGGKLMAVFGCAGLRDTAKRPVMGRIGSELADLAIFTAEDPRTEDIWSILRQMKEGIVDTHSKIASVADRKAAIQFAINQVTSSKDIVVILGKGHEQSMCYGTEEIPWSDAKVVREILSKK